MKYKCTDCGKIYTDKVKYCECGNDKFHNIFSESEKKLNNSKVTYNYQEPKKKENPLFVVAFFIFLCFIVYFIMSKLMNYKTEKDDNRQAYVDKLQKNIFSDFNPEGITKSGYCIISFEIDENGAINNKKFIKISQVEELDKKVFDMINSVKSVEKPPVSLINKTINYEIGCIANEKEVECYNKPYKKD